MGTVPIYPLNGDSPHLSVLPDLAAPRRSRIGFAVHFIGRYLGERIVEVVDRRCRRDYQLADADGEAVEPFADIGLHGPWGSDSEYGDHTAFASAQSPSTAWLAI